MEFTLIFDKLSSIEKKLFDSWNTTYSINLPGIYFPLFA